MIKLLKSIPKPIIFIIIALALIILTVVLLYTRPEKLSVVDTSPKNLSRDIFVTTEVSVSFNRAPTEKETKNIEVKIDLSEKFEIMWSNETLKLVFSSELKTDTKYEIDIKYKNKSIYKFSFSTNPFTKEIIEKEGSLQSEDDLLYGEVYKKFLAEYPWYQSLPINKSDYKIIYDFDRKSFRIRLKVEPEDKKDQDRIIENALNDIKSIGVKEPVSYYVLEIDEYL